MEPEPVTFQNSEPEPEKIVTVPQRCKQGPDIVAALRAALLRNNLLVDVKLDAVSLVIPNKRLYEVIYNRVGNDLLLWVPTYLAVKEKRRHPGHEV